jgi:hypothetical protein
MVIVHTRRCHPWFGRPNPPVPGRGPDVRAVVRRELSDIGIPPQSVFAAAPIVLPRSSYAELFRATAALLDLQRRVVLHSAAATEGRMAAYRATTADYPLFHDDPVLEERYATAVCRPDIVIGPHGPRFVEFNVAGAAGGVVELHCLLRAWQHLYRDSATPAFHSHDPFAASAAMFHGATDELDLPKSVALLGSLRDIHYTDSSRYFDLEVAFLRDAGLTTDFIEPEDLADRGREFRLGLRHFTIVEWAEYGIDLTPVADAISNGMVLLTTQTAAFLDNKKTLGMLSEGQPWMTDAERATVDRYLPWTRILRDGPTTRDGARIDLIPMVLREKDKLLIKPGIGMQGKGIVLGHQATTAEWTREVERVATAQSGIVQEWVEPESIPVALTVDDDAEVNTVDVAPVLSPFLFDGHWGGVYARFRASGERGIVSQDTGGAQQNAVVTA